MKTSWHKKLGPPGRRQLRAYQNWCNDNNVPHGTPMPLQFPAPQVSYLPVPESCYKCSAPNSAMLHEIEVGYLCLMCGSYTYHSIGNRELPSRGHHQK